MIKSRFYLDCRRVAEGAPAPLKVAIFKNGVRALISLNVSVLPGDWDAAAQRVSDRSLQELIVERKAYIDAFIFKKESEGVLAAMRACEVKDFVIANLFDSGASVSRGCLFVERLCAFADRHGASTRAMYLHTLSRLRAFGRFEGVDMDGVVFEAIDVGWLRRFDDFLGRTAPSRNARNIHLRNIRAVFNDALDDGVISCYPFRKFKIRPVATRKRALSVDDLRRLIVFPVEGYAEVYRDMFVLSFLLCGINMVDLFNLEGITGDGRVEYRRAKTHRLYSVRVEPEALEIINRYRGKGRLLCLADRWGDHRNFIHQMNKALQRIGAVRTGLGGRKGKGVFEGLSSYWARHSWATMAAGLDIPKETIAAGLGHGGNSVTDVYIDFDRGKVDRANRRIIDFVFYGGERSDLGGDCGGRVAGVPCAVPDESVPEDVLCLSPKAMVYARAYFRGEMLAEVSDIGFGTVEAVIERLARQLPDTIPDKCAVQFRIKNVDADREAVYERTKGKGFFAGQSDHRGR